jgi:hypothetical protein
MPRTENRLQLNEIVIEIGAKEHKLVDLGSSILVTIPCASHLLLLIHDCSIHVDQALLDGLKFYLSLCLRWVRKRVEEE